MPHHIVDALSESGDPSQSEVVAFLGDSRTHEGRPVSRIDTPISHVFIAGPTTYKLKRAVKRNFVDYSTPELRKVHCQREVDINSNYAPEIYRGIKAITRSEQGLELEGSGPPIDYVVVMQTFDPEKTFDKLADAGELTEKLIYEFADLTANIHRQTSAATQFGGAENMSSIVVQVAQAIQQSPVGQTLEPEIDAWRKAAEAAITNHSDQLNCRRRHGYVRRCHGDLHLANICMFEGHPTPFDAIEFSDEIASVDILYDLAFTIMDLHRRGLRSHANRLLSRYLNITRDYSGLSALPLFVSLRAAVRAMVAASDNGVPNALTDARKRLKFAQACLDHDTVEMNSQTPMLVAIGGLSGSGKSTLARQLAPEVPGLCGAVSIRSDVVRKRLFDITPESPLPETAYTPDISQKVYTRLLRDAARALRTGTSVILDATFIEGEKTTSLEIMAQRAGASFRGLWLSLDLETLQQRIRGRGADASDATPAVAASQWQSVRENPAWTKLNASHSPSEVAAQARRAIGL